MKLDPKDKEILEAARCETDTIGTWCPWHGAKGRAVDLVKSNMLKRAGIKAFTRSPLYIITDAGRAALTTGNTPTAGKGGEHG